MLDSTPRSFNLLVLRHLHRLAHDVWIGGEVRLCCTNPVWDSSRESSVIAGGHEQTEHTDRQDAELASL